LARDKIILQQAINEGLVPLGEPIVKTIKWHLRANGVFLDSQEIDLHIFYQHLEGIVGNIADVVINEIYEVLKTKYADSPVTFDSEMNALDRIDILLDMQSGGDTTAC
jgi:hypothetical protein